LIDKELVSYRQHDQQAIGAKQSMIGQGKMNELLSDKKKSKKAHFESFTAYLKIYSELISLTKGDNEIKNLIIQSIQFHEQRQLMIDNSLLNKFVYASQSLLAGKYYKYSQYPYKEFARDIL